MYWIVTAVVGEEEEEEEKDRRETGGLATALFERQSEGTEVGGSPARWEGPGRTDARTCATSPGVPDVLVNALLLELIFMLFVNAKLVSQAKLKGSYSTKPFESAQ